MVDDHIRPAAWRGMLLRKRLRHAWTAAAIIAGFAAALMSIEGDHRALDHALAHRPGGGIALVLTPFVIFWAVFGIVRGIGWVVGIIPDDGPPQRSTFRGRFALALFVVVCAGVPLYIIMFSR